MIIYKFVCQTNIQNINSLQRFCIDIFKINTYFINNI